MFRNCFVFDHRYFSAAGSLTIPGTGKVSNHEMSRGCLEAQYETVNAALAEYIERREQTRIIEAFGTVDFDSAYDYKKQRKRA